jgi:hypothetical protein
MKLITVDDKLYQVIHIYEGNFPTNLDATKAKVMWRCDTVLKSGNNMYLCRIVLNAEFEEL